MDEKTVPRTDPVTIMTGDAARAVYDWILEDGIKPHADLIAPIVIRGDIAVVVFRPLPETAEAARAIGWNGKAPVFRLGNGSRKRMVRALAEQGDEVSARWFAAKRDGRIYINVEGGTFLVNFEPGKGYSLEPGSSDFDKRSHGGGAPS